MPAAAALPRQQRLLAMMIWGWRPWRARHALLLLLLLPLGQLRVQRVGGQLRGIVLAEHLQLALPGPLRQCLQLEVRDLCVSHARPAPGSA